MPSPPSCMYRDSWQSKGSNYGIYGSSQHAFQTGDHSRSSPSCYQFPKESEESFPLFPMVIEPLAPNDIMDIQLAIVSAQCFMHDILRTVQNTTLTF